MYIHNQKKSHQRSIRMTPYVYSVIDEFEGEGFNQKFENLVIYFSTVEKQLKENILEKKKEIKTLDEKIDEKSSILEKLNNIEYYVDGILRSNPKAKDLSR